MKARPGSLRTYPVNQSCSTWAGHLGGSWGDTTFLLVSGLVPVKSLCIAGKTRASAALYFLWVQTCFACETLVTKKFSARWNGVFTGMEKNVKIRRNFLFPLFTLNAFHYSRPLRLYARNLTYEGKLVKTKPIPLILISMWKNPFHVGQLQNRSSEPRQPNLLWTVDLGDSRSFPSSCGEGGTPPCRVVTSQSEFATAVVCMQ